MQAISKTISNIANRGQTNKLVLNCQCGVCFGVEGGQIIRATCRSCGLAFCEGGFKWIFQTPASHRRCPICKSWNSVDTVYGDLEEVANHSEIIEDINTVKFVQERGRPIEGVNEACQAGQMIMQDVNEKRNRRLTRSSSVLEGIPMKEINLMTKLTKSLK